MKCKLAFNLFVFVLVKKNRGSYHVKVLLFVCFYVVQGISVVSEVLTSFSFLN